MPYPREGANIFPEFCTGHSQYVMVCPCTSIWGRVKIRVHNGWLLPSNYCKMKALNLDSAPPWSQKKHANIAASDSRDDIISSTFQDAWWGWRPTKQKHAAETIPKMRRQHAISCFIDQCLSIQIVFKWDQMGTWLGPQEFRRIVKPLLKGEKTSPWKYKGGPV